jgi:glycosyltransferase involved in cell wall biosynthesis
LSYTPKGNLYSSIARIGLGVKHIMNISGLGHANREKVFVRWLVRGLYRIACKCSYWVFFQNEDDYTSFTRAGVVDLRRSERLPGSGIDLSVFSPTPLPCESNEICDGSVVFLLMARMLWEKGIGDYVEAARRIQIKFPKATFQLLGFIENNRRGAVPENQIKSWVAEGTIEYLGQTDDVRDVLRTVDCVVLPSYYREGVPRSLLEGAAMGRPLITTDTPGCRDTVEDKVSGFLCRPHDVDSLVSCIDAFMHLKPEQRTEFGRRARHKVETEFDEEFVLDRYIQILIRLTAAQSNSTRDSVEAE